MFKRRRKAEPKRYFWSLFRDPPPPPCPLHGDRCGQFNLMDDVWVADFRPCPAREAAIRRTEFAQSHQAVFNPITGNFDVHPR
jgi:hypothetical protein